MRGWLSWYLLLPIFLSWGCKSDEQKKAEMPDRFDTGTIHISCDESFKPVIDQEVKVYEALHPGTKIIVHYKPEAECLKDFAVDSIRMVIATRGFTPAEEKFLSDSMKVDASNMLIAFDAIAAIVHPQSPDTLLKMDEIKSVLLGKSPKKLRP